MMREELKEYLHTGQTVTGKITKFSKMSFDGKENILEEDPETGKKSPLRFNVSGSIDAVRFINQTTLLTDVKIDGKLVGDGHLWITQDLSQKGFNQNDMVKVSGTIEAYKKKAGVDFCIDPFRFEHCK